jgi:hypothetical protein
MFVRPLRIIGIFLSTVAVFLIFNWFLNTLLPLNRLNALQPSVALADTALQPEAALLECHMSQNWSANLKGLLLNCGDNEVRVNRNVTEIKNMPTYVSGKVKAIAPSDPVVIVGKTASGNVVDAEIVAYGSRATNLSVFQANGIMQIVLAEIVGVLGLLALFIDWRLARAKRARRKMQAWQAEQAYAASPRLVEQPVYQRRR